MCSSLDQQKLPSAFDAFRLKVKVNRIYALKRSQGIVLK
jgi:hypothetical protein